MQSSEGGGVVVAKEILILSTKSFQIRENEDIKYL